MKNPATLLALRSTLLMLCEGETCLALAYRARTPEDEAFLHKEILPWFEFQQVELADNCTLFMCRRLESSVEP